MCRGVNALVQVGVFSDDVLRERVVKITFNKTKVILEHSQTALDYWLDAHGFAATAYCHIPLITNTRLI